MHLNEVEAILKLTLLRLQKKRQSFVMLAPVTYKRLSLHCMVLYALTRSDDLALSLQKPVNTNFETKQSYGKQMPLAY